jgi:hypothetical protein
LRADIFLASPPAFTVNAMLKQAMNRATGWNGRRHGMQKRASGIARLHNDE